MERGRGPNLKTTLKRAFAKRPVIVIAVCVLVFAPTAVALRLESSPSALRTTGPSRAIRGGQVQPDKLRATVAVPGHRAKPTVVSHPRTLHLQKARSAVFDVRKLKSTVVKRERPEAGDLRSEAGDLRDSEPPPAALLPSVSLKTIAAAASAPAPSPDSSFDGLDFANWGAGHPPDENGDVGPTYYIQTVNTSIGIYDKSNGTRVAAFTFNAFMSQGHFGNLCDTDNFGDPVVLYDSFENRWFITDFAFKLDASGNVVNPPGAFQCFAVSKTADPVNGGWNFYSIAAPGALDDYPKFGVWPDGIYMSANMFGYPAGASYTGYHVWALNKQQMYAGAPSPQVVDFAGDTSDFTVIPANARLEAGAPATGESEFFVSTEQFLNALSIYKFHVDWDKPSTSTFTGPQTQLQPNCWPNATPANAATTANAADVLAIRAMAQAQYSNIGGAESLWVDHTVQRNVSATNTTCNATTGGNASIRWYQANVTGGNVAANVVQGQTFDPEAANTFFRYVPSLAVDRLGDMAVGYTKSNSTTNPQIKYAGRLVGDPANTLGQTEQTLINGTGSQSGNCGSSACTRWGDYSGMSLDPNGCEFWMTGEYFATTGLNDLTRIGSFKLNPACTAVGNGALSGTITDGTNPISGATVALGNRTTTTDGSGNYSFSVPAGTYASLTAGKAGFNDGSFSTIAVPDGGSATRNFTLTTAAPSGCFTDNSQSTFLRGNPSNCDLVSNPGSVVLAAPDNTAAKNNNVNPTGFGFTNTTWAGQTFTPTVSGQLKRVDVELFCSGCTAPGPNIVLSIRATSAGTPTGADLGSATIAGFNDGAAGGLHTFTFPTPVAVTAGTRYAFVFRNSAAFASGTMAYTCSCATTGFSDSNPYANGQRVTSTNSGGTWTADTTVGGRDLNFVTYINPGFASSGTFVSSLKDANPAPGSTPTWTTLSFTATQPAGTSVKFQVAGSNSQYGPFNFVGPDGTANTFFTTSGAGLSQFNGVRYLKYEAFLSTNSGSVTPTLSSVAVCFQDTSGASATGLAVDPASGTYGGTANLSATLTSSGTGVSGESVSFTLNGSSVGSAVTNGSGVAGLSGVSLTGINAGSYPSGVGASFAGDSSYGASSGSGSLTVVKANQTITVTTHAPASAVFGTSFDVAATAESGMAVGFSSAGACTNTGAHFTMTSGTGTCSVRYDQAGNGNYNVAPQVTESVTAQKAGQTITITKHAPSSAAYNDSFSVTATASSGLGVSFSSAGSCGNTGNVFTITSGSGTCSVKYDQAGNANYNAAPQVTESVTAQKANQTITVTTHAPTDANYNSSFDVAATAAPGLPVSFSSGGVCTNTGAHFTITSGSGTCTVQYDQPGNANYNPAPQVTESVTAHKAGQSITVTTHAPASAKYGLSFGVAATGGGSGNPVTYSSSGECSNVANAFTMTGGTGTCSVKYDQAGDANYDAATQVTETVTAAKADQTITITTHAPTVSAYGSSFDVDATADSGLAVAFSNAGVCSSSAAHFTMTGGTGTCSVKYDQAGDANHNAAPQVTESVTAQKADQTISVTTHAPTDATYSSTFPVAANASSGLAVSFGSAGACGNASSFFTMTSGTGTCSVQYDQAGNGNYNAAPQVTESVTAHKADQTITITTNAPTSAPLNSSFDVAGTADSGLPVSYSSSGACNNSGAHFTTAGTAGTCAVKYDQAGDANNNAAPQVKESVDVSSGKVSQTITVTIHAPASAAYGGSFDVDATADSGLAVSFSSAGACTNTGGHFTMTSAGGTCTVNYDQAGNDGYEAAPQVTETVNATKADQTLAVTTHAPSDVLYNSAFDVAATADSGLDVSVSTSGACSNSGGHVTMTSGTGTCAVKYDQAGNANYDAAPTVTESVNALKATLTVGPNPATASRQYSDPNPAFAASITGFVNGDGAGSLTGQPSCAAGATTASAPGPYGISCSGGSSPNYMFSYSGGTLTVGQEDARTTYIGAASFVTSSPSSTTASVRLISTIRDISAVSGDPAFDSFPGDIRNATVTFVNRATGNAFIGCASRPVTLTVPTDSTVGTATCTTSLAAPAKGQAQYKVGTIVGSYYSRNTTAEDKVITVKRGSKKAAPAALLMCYRHHTVRVVKRKVKTLRKRGAKPGACKRHR